MVHKKYIKIKGKTYGPYYYESYREGDKIKKKYVKRDELKEINKKRNREYVRSRVNKKRAVKRNRKKIINFTVFYFLIVAVLLASVAYLYFTPSDFSFEEEILEPEVFFAPSGASSGTSAGGEALLEIYDSTDLGEDRFSRTPVDFYANYTDLAVAINPVPIDDGATYLGACEITYDLSVEGGPVIGPEAMTYDSIETIWGVTKSFDYKGIHSFEIICTSSVADVTLVNSFLISNTKPFINQTLGGFVEFDGNEFTTDTLSCVEDTLCLFDISSVSEEFDINDDLTYDFILGSNSTLTNFSIDSISGMLTINITRNENTGLKALELSIEDDSAARDTAVLNVKIDPFNDPPIFSNLVNQSFNRSFLFEYEIITSDEENDFPLTFGIEFLSCNLAPWSTKPDCELFNESDYFIDGDLGVINLSFTPDKDDVGIYLINFSAVDAGVPSGAITSKIVEFEVVNINEAPILTNICDGLSVAVEDTEFNCYVNATDLDEVNYLTYFANESWFLPFIDVITGVSTGFKSGVLVNFTVDDREVGNWNINISVNDTGSPVMYNSSVISFFVGNVDDAVILNDIADVNAYTSNIYAIYVNASDDDLLIPDKSVYNEIISFESNTSWVSAGVFKVISGSNITTGVITFDPNDSPGIGSYDIGITARDSNGFSFYIKVFTINVINNNRPVWDLGTVTEYSLTEDVPFVLNLSENVNDPDGDALTFSFLSDTSFAGFSLDTATGMINFIPSDEDIGVHFVEINASDSIFSASLTFNFTVFNVNDDPSIVSVVGNNVTIDSSFNLGVFEDDDVDIFVFVRDDDIVVPDEQSGFFEEVFTIETGLDGPNMGLFTFVEKLEFPPNEIMFAATFIPRKTDIGNYNISFNVTDLAWSVVRYEVNLSVSEIEHTPELMNLSDQSSTVNRDLYYDINATDLEDGNDSTELMTFSYEFLGDGRTDDFIVSNENKFNSTSGILNVSFSVLDAGAYHLNISVVDSAGFIDSGDFWIFVYNNPGISFPGLGFVFNLTEGELSNLSFIANSSGLGNLTYEFYIDDVVRYSVSNYGNGSKVIWQFTPNFEDETYGVFGNLTLKVFIVGFEEMNSSRTWNTNISHANDGVDFIKNIGDKESVYGKPILINLKEHFSDVDYFDIFYNQTVNFSIQSDNNSSGISYSVDVNWTLSLEASEVLAEILNITVSDLNLSNNVLTSAVSNNFEIRFTEPIEIQVPQSQPSGGGDDEEKKLVALKIIVPDPTSAKKGARIDLPIEIVNNGFTNLRNINLDSLIALDGVLKEDVIMSFSRSNFESLAVGESEKVVLTVIMPEDKLGLYEITLSAIVSDPEYIDTGKILINVEEGETIAERILFTEEFLAENPECVELTELVRESESYINVGNFNAAEKKLQIAISGCKEAISQRPLFSRANFREKLQDDLFRYLLIVTVLAIVLGVVYYFYKRMMLKRALEENI